MTGRGSKTSYILMNKEVPILEFRCQRNEFDEPEFFEGQWLIASRPIGYHNLVAFLKQRRSPKHRKHIKQLLEQYGCDDLDVFLHTTHALSLNDTFWVREADSPLTWKDVSLYTGPFNEIVSESAFDGLVREKEHLPPLRNLERMAVTLNAGNTKSVISSSIKGAVHIMGLSRSPSTWLHSYPPGYVLELCHTI